MTTGFFLVSVTLFVEGALFVEVFSFDADDLLRRLCFWHSLSYKMEYSDLVSRSLTIEFK
jgi:hypothetical protein